MEKRSPEYVCVYGQGQIETTGEHAEVTGQARGYYKKKGTQRENTFSIYLEFKFGREVGATC